ncbi:MAG: TIGR02594 family protein [Reyranella sp.]|nr:TIGR02594 family protein [Reyranella sp.]
MADFTVTQDTPLFAAANMASPMLGVVKAGMDIQGEEQQGFVKTRVDQVAVEEGFVAFLALQEKPSLPQPISDDRVGVFIALITRLARDVGADRDYMLAAAYAGTNNLKNLGGPGDGPIGPFQMSAKDWNEAITTGPAQGLGFTSQDRYRWSSQAEVAARLTAAAMASYQEAMGKAPQFAELYFARLYGNGGHDLLKGDRSAKCSDIIKDAAPGSYADKLAKGAGTIASVIDDLKASLIAAYTVAREEIDKQPSAIRFFRKDEKPATGEPPWLTVARAEMFRGVSETPDLRNTADIKAYLRVAGLDDPGDKTPWCGAFIAFCMKTCGVKEIADSVVRSAGLASSWENWGSPVSEPFPPGTVVVLNDNAGNAGHVGLIVGSDAANVQVLGGNQGGGRVGPDKVGIVPFARSSIRKTVIMAVAPPPAVAGIGAEVNLVALRDAGGSATPQDADFATKAPRVMRDLMRDLPGLTSFQAAAILGNIGHECGGFRQLVQIGLPEGKGGMGWCQWDGARRGTFLAFAADRKLNWRSDEANYGYLLQELRGTEKAAFDSLLRQTSLEAAVVNFDERFERSGVKALDKRTRFARLALAAFGG